MNYFLLKECIYLKIYIIYIILITIIYKFRIQIKLVTIAFFMSDVIELTLTILKHYYFSYEFIRVDFASFPQTKSAAVIMFIYCLSNLMPIFTNYLGFYYLIRQGYKPYINKFSETSISVNDIEDLIEKDKNVNKEIDDYLKRDSNLK
jgi:hypothetical protein